MDPLKEAFARVREDIDYLCYELEEIKRTLKEIKTQISSQPTDRQHSTDTSTDNYPLEAGKSPNFNISIGNKGVSTDRQTDQQTDRQPLHFLWKSQEKPSNTPINNSEIHTKHQEKQSEIENSKYNQNSTHFQSQSPLTRATELLESLDDLKKEVRFKFKKLTTQEMLVFTKIYELEEQGFIVDYTILSEKLDLTESSIRDYVLRLIKKGIPLEKTKENNKKIVLSISQNLKKVASLETINQLRIL